MRRVGGSWSFTLIHSFLWLWLLLFAMRCHCRLLLLSHPLNLVWIQGMCCSPLNMRREPSDCQGLQLRLANYPGGTKRREGEGGRQWQMQARRAWEAFYRCVRRPCCCHQLGNASVWFWCDMGRAHGTPSAGFKGARISLCSLPRGRHRQKPLDKCCCPTTSMAASIGVYTKFHTEKKKKFSSWFISFLQMEQVSGGYMWVMMMTWGWYGRRVLICGQQTHGCCVGIVHRRVEYHTEIIKVLVHPNGANGAV
jgi:hypothetical protein